MWKIFFRRIQWWRSEVEIRTGRRSNRRSKMAEKSRVTPPRGQHESLVPGVSSSWLRPDSDQSRIWCRARPWLLCDSLNELTYLCGTLTVWQSFFFFFFWSFRECCLTRQWQSTECDTWYMVQRKNFDVIKFSSLSAPTKTEELTAGSDDFVGAEREENLIRMIPTRASLRYNFDVILRFLVDRYRRTKLPKPDASQFVVPARLPKPVTGSGGVSSSRFDDDVPKSTAHEQRRSLGESRKLRLDSNRTAPTIWQEGQHGLHSLPQLIDWWEHTTGAVHDRNLPTS